MGQSNTIPAINTKYQTFSETGHHTQSSTYSRFKPNREDWMFSYDFMKSKALFDPRPRSSIYIKNRNKDKWSRPYDPFRTLGQERENANRNAIVAKSMVLTNSLVNPHPYILSLPQSQDRLQRGQQSYNNYANTVNSVPESRYDPSKHGSRAWANTNVSQYGLS